MAHKRKRMFYTFKEATQAGAYDEVPMLPPGIDPQLHLSRNDCKQPFWLIHEKDAVIIQMSGASRVEMREGPVLWEDLRPGDFLYVPSGTPHRIDPKEASVMYRFKAEQAGLEAVAWYCEGCRTALYRYVWDTARQVPQAGYQQACAEFNANADYRTCGGCGTVHPAIALEAFRWSTLAKEMTDTA